MVRAAREMEGEDLNAEERQFMGNRFRGYKKNKEVRSYNLDDFMCQGGIEVIEYMAAAKAADEAKQFEREYWLPILEEWLSQLDETDKFYVLRREYLKDNIKYLRQKSMTPEERKADNRQRRKDGKLSVSEMDKLWDKYSKSAKWAAAKKRFQVSPIGSKPASSYRFKTSHVSIS